jgi:GNAT superfamily N-acetyltransferase
MAMINTANLALRKADVVGSAEDLRIAIRFENELDREIFGESFGKEDADNTESSLLYRMKTISQNTILIAENGSPVGYVEYCPSDGILGLANLYVVPPCRHQGVGSRMLDEVIKFARVGGMGSVRAYAGASSIDFFRSKGFVNKCEPRDFTRMMLLLNS